MRLDRIFARFDEATMMRVARRAMLGMSIRYSPLWDIVALVLLVGVGVSIVTSILPACRRLARHARTLMPVRSLREERRDVRSPLLGGDARR